MAHDLTDPFTVTRSATFGDWQAQLKMACEGDRREDIDAIASLRPPHQVVLRHVTVTKGRGQFSVTKNTMLISGGKSTTSYADELIPYEAMSQANYNCPCLPTLPEPDSPEAAALSHRLLHEPHQFSGSCLFWGKSLEALRLLEAKGADTHGLGWMGIPLLVFMAGAGQFDIVRFLIAKRGHDPNVARANGNYTALHWADGLPIVQYLLEQGGDANILTSSGDSVLAQQLRNGRADVIDYLLGLGEERVSRANLLHWLAAKPEILRVLCRHHIPLDTPIESTFMERSTPKAMHRVLVSGIEAWGYRQDAQDKNTVADAIVESVEILLGYGCDPLLRDGGGRLPYHIVQDLIPDTAESLRLRLDAQLARYDGPRESPPKKKKPRTVKASASR